MIRTYEFHIEGEIIKLDDWCIWDDKPIKVSAPKIATVVASSLESAQKTIDKRYPNSNNTFKCSW